MGLLDLIREIYCCRVSTILLNNYVRPQSFEFLRGKMLARQNRGLSNICRSGYQQTSNDDNAAEEAVPGTANAFSN